MLNPTSRMVVPPVAPTQKPEPIAQQIPAAEPAKPEEQVVEEVPTDENAPPAIDENTRSIKDEELITDLDLENFYMTGEIFYEFKLNEKLPVKFKMIDSKTLMEMNDFLFSCYKAERAVKSVILEHSMKILAKAMVRYGQTNLESLSEAKRLEFVERLPSMVLPVLARKYSIFEASVDKKLTAENLKN